MVAPSRIFVNDKQFVFACLKRLYNHGDNLAEELMTLETSKK